MPLIQNLFYRPLLITLKSLRINLQRRVHKRKIEKMGESRCIENFEKFSVLVVNTTKSLYIAIFSPVSTFPLFFDLWNNFWCPPMLSETVQTISGWAVEAIFDRTHRKNLSTKKIFCWSDWIRVVLPQPSLVLFTRYLGSSEPSNFSRL